MRRITVLAAVPVMINPVETFGFGEEISASLAIATGGAA